MAIDNGAVDTLRSMTAKGLLSTLLRARDGDEVTVEALSKTHDEGRESLAKAMRILVDHAFVVKFKIQRRRSETVELADGSRQEKRGGSWYTTFSVDSIAFTAEDVAVMLDEVKAGGNVKAVRVEPAHLDPQKTAERPTTGKPYVGPTCDDTEEPQAAPTYGKPTVGQPMTGRAAAKKIKTGGEEDSLSDAWASRDDGREREAATPEAGRGNSETSRAGEDADVVVNAYVTALGRPLVNGSRERLREQAVQLLTAGYPVGWLAARAAEMPANGWRDLVRHAEASRVPIPGQGGPAGGGGAPGGERRSTPAEVEALRARIAMLGSGL
ncbi:hypothetical protein [Streptomyces sp. NPDC090056]|uniref:hypothetical protein n=1 Tax=Streptomyces sp. NPDC090056 TaxID=3365934 RepID=UPI00382E50AC